MGASLYPETKDKHLTLYVPEDLHVKLDDFAEGAMKALKVKKTGKQPKVSRSQVVRYILEKFFEDNSDFSEIYFGISEPKFSRTSGRKKGKR